MIYLYNCIQCNEEFEIIKPMRESGREEICTTCNLVLQRVFTVPMFSVADSSSSFMNDEKKKFRDKNDGSEMIEVGTDRKNCMNNKPTYKSYDIPREVMANLED